MKLPKPQLPHPTKRSVTVGLYILGFLLYGVVFFLGLNQLAETRRVATQTASISASTNQLIKSQNEVLSAIKGVTDDTKMTAEQQTAIIICMLQVPVEQRTTDLQANCRKQAGVSSATSSSSGSTSGTSNSVTGNSQSSSSPNNVTNISPVQPNSVQAPKGILQRLLHAPKRIIDKVRGK